MKKLTFLLILLLSLSGLSSLQARPSWYTPYWDLYSVFFGVVEFDSTVVVDQLSMNSIQIGDDGFYVDSTKLFINNIYTNDSLQYLDQSDIFDISYNTNLFNPDEALDSVVLDYLTGNIQTFANNMSTAPHQIAVEAGQSYIISLPDTETYPPSALIYCWNADTTFIGMSRQLSTYPVADGITAKNSTVFDGKKSVIISLDNDTEVKYIAYSLQNSYTTHTPNDFDRIRNSMTFELAENYIGSNKWGDTTIVVGNIQEEKMPESYKSIKGATDGGLTIRVDGDSLFWRTDWNDDYDYVSGMDGLSDNEIEFNNNAVNYIKQGLINSSLPLAFTSTDAVEATIKTSNDDAAPICINGTYIGANHGGNFVNEITVTGHGKTVVDVGSEWEDTGSYSFYIMRIVDDNTLWVISENQATSPYWSFRLSITGNSLTHVSGATHTDAMTITANTTEQLKPAYRNIEKTAYLNGRKAIETDGVYTCDYLDVVHTYDIMDIPDVIDYVVSQVGSTTQPSFTDESIDTAVKVRITYRIFENGSTTIYQNIQPLQDVKLGYLGFIQSSAITLASGDSLFGYIPKTTSYTTAGRTYDWANIQNLTVYSDSYEIDSADWVDPNDPPDRFIQFTQDSDEEKKYGICLGYNLDKGLSKPSERKDLVGSSYLVYSSKKMYPKAISSGANIDTLKAGDIYDVVAYRYPINYNIADVTNYGWYQVNDVVYVNFDIHKDTSNCLLELPHRFEGYNIEVIENSSSFRLNSRYVGNDGIIVDVNDQYGYAILKLSPSNDYVTKDYLYSFKGNAGFNNNTDTTEIATALVPYPVRGTFNNELDNYYLCGDADWPGICVDSTLVDSIQLKMQFDGHAFVDANNTEIYGGFQITRANGTTITYQMTPTYSETANVTVPVVFTGFPKVGAKDKISIVTSADKDNMTVTFEDIKTWIEIWRVNP